MATMQYALLGSTGLPVSRLAFGAMTFTAGDQSIPAIYTVGEHAAEAMVGRALDAGINLFDTADGYAGGQSEVMLGRFLKARRDEAVIATKVGFRSGETPTRSGLNRRHILWSIDQSLTRLGTDWVDLYIVHREDPLTPLEETLAALDAVVRSGKARYIGFSNWSAWKVAAALELQKANGWARFSHGQVHYSLLGRDVERDMVPLTRHYGLGLTVWGPLAFGFLSGKYTPDTPIQTGNRLAGFDILPFSKEHGFRVVETVRAIAKAHDATVAQTAIAWLLARGAVTSILLGASKPHQLEDNLGAADLHLSDEEVATLDAATALPPVYPFWFNDAMVDRPLLDRLAGR